ncbi:unnamed protein product [Eruca vesicaria subsp. sativa]|uniref:F-box associated beta-propeller type 1 domain-containing protein n=1 Tax=Eruca vesicaria subsp. sativa TaxID=29727 RepID=A0ABC8L4Q4_ERUVS|nr:unnamed protein product [Eruca vesicaria subsp. sativa]
MEVWLTKKIGDDESVPWRLLFRVDSGYNNKSTLNQHFMSFMVDEENKVALCFLDECIEENCDNQRTILYVVVEGSKVIRLIGPPDPHWNRKPMPYLFSYVPSLLQI